MRSGKGEGTEKYIWGEEESDTHPPGKVKPVKQLRCPVPPLRLSKSRQHFPCFLQEATTPNPRLSPTSGEAGAEQKQSWCYEKTHTALLCSQTS